MFDINDKIKTPSALLNTTKRALKLGTLDTATTVNVLTAACSDSDIFRTRLYIYFKFIVSYFFMRVFTAHNSKAKAQGDIQFW